MLKSKNYVINLVLRHELKVFEPQKFSHTYFLHLFSFITVMVSQKNVLCVCIL